MHIDAIKPGDKVVIIDDLLATGGTSQATVELIESLGGEVVKLVYLIELDFLKGRDKLKNYDVDAIIHK
jgi:adenine phosphoribosyltransferase